MILASMARQRKLFGLMTAVECRVEAVALRTISTHAHLPSSRAKILAMAEEWDRRGAVIDLEAAAVIG
jgi:hypothetical protein